MFVGDSDEVDALVPEELGKDKQGLIDMGTTEAKRATPKLRPRPVCVFWPYHPVPAPISADALQGPVHDTTSIDDVTELIWPRELREFEGGVNPF